MRRFLVCLTMAGALVAGGAATAPIASAEAATGSARAAEDHYLFEGHYSSQEACEARAEYLITTQPWNYYDYICAVGHPGEPDEFYTLYLAYYA